MLRHAAISCATVLALVPFAAAQAPPANCAGAEHRQFDFWVGLWTVTDTVAGTFAGINRIAPREGGCVLQEKWTSARGAYTGTSLNWFGEGRWHQIWLDSMGQQLELTGGIVDGKMVMEGLPKQRVTWTPIDKDTVRQRWEMSANEGKTWSVAFDGTYHRVQEASAVAAPAGDAGLLARLAGDWIGTGTVTKQQIVAQLSIRPVLNGRATMLHWMNLGGDASRTLFEGRAIYVRQPDGQYRARWWDTLGSEHPIMASERGATLEALWGEGGRTVYELLDTGELRVIDSVKGKDGAWHEFGRTQLQRGSIR